MAAGIEIPVFCYEPRLGPPVGACRMCLVEIEGMPKLQAGCTLTVQRRHGDQDGATSEKAAEGQEATLEFILVNHPLDCPVCDKGGECPLQDLTFRYGPGNTRMSFAKLTVDKPIPVSPLIALDRERCILCYRCTRFSEDVAEDGQLIARNRGAHTEIATFEDEPYRSPFSGNVVELCPVGALTSTLYRFEARPWDIQNVPTVCTACAGRLQRRRRRSARGRSSASSRRNHPEIDRGWLCDKGRFTYPHLRAEDRITTPLRRGTKGLEEISWDEALDAAEALLREAARLDRHRALRLRDDRARVRARDGSCAAGSARTRPCCPEATSDALDAFRLAALSAIGDAEIVVVVGDDPVVERAPIVDLWIKEARRHGAEVVVCSPDRHGPDGAARGAAPRRAASSPTRAARSGRSCARPSGRCSSGPGPGGGGGARIAELAHALGFERQARLRRVPSPDAPPTRAASPLGWAVAADADETNPEPIELLFVSGDEAAADPDVRALAEQAKRVIVADDVPRARGRLGRPRPPRDGLARARRDVDEPRGPRAARSAARSLPPCPDELAWISKLAARFDVDVSPHAAGVFDELAAELFRDLTLDELGLHAPLPARHPYVAPTPAMPRRRRPTASRRALRGRAPAPPLPAALLRPGRRARPGAPLPAARARGRALAGRRRAARDRDRRRRRSSARTARRSSSARASTASSSRASRASPTSTRATSTRPSRW